MVGRHNLHLSGVWWADIIYICIIDYTSPRPVGKASVNVLLYLEECTTSEVRVCGRIFFSHGRDLAGFEHRTFRFQGFPEGRDLNPGPLGSRGFQRGGLDVSGFRRIHWATGPHTRRKNNSI